MKQFIKINIAVLAALCLSVPALAGGGVPADSVAVRLVLPFGRIMDKSLSTGTSTTFHENDINKYPTSDIRLALNGVIPGLIITEKSGISGGMYGQESDRVTMTARGHSVNMVVDGVYVNPYEIQLDAEEIESVTLIRDVVDKARFGSRASSGVLYITTKKGLPYGRTIKVGVESGVSVAGLMPEWVGGVDYAILQNQALLESGRPEQYSESDIKRFSANMANDLMYPNVDWRSMMYKDTKPFTKANLAIAGGSDAVRYSLNLGYLGEGDIYKAGKNSTYDRFNVRTHIDVGITETLRFKLGLSSNLSFRTSPVYGSAESSVVSNEFNRFISATNSIPPVAFPVQIGINPENGSFIYGVSERYTSNPYAALVECGSTTYRSRSGIFNASLGWDAGKILKGLRFETNADYNILNMDRIGKNPDYLAMIYDTSTGESLKTSHEGAKVSGKSNYGKWYHQTIILNERAVYDYSRGDHDLNASAMYYLESTERSGSSVRERQQSAVLAADYAYKKRYLIQTTLNTSGSSMFLKGRRFGFFPSAGLGWVVSQEDFLRHSSYVNYLKISAQAGKVAYNPFNSMNLFEDKYTKDKGILFGPATQGFEWLGSYTRYQSYVTNLERLGNPDLTWENRIEYSAALETRLFSNRLYVNADWYYVLRDGIITNTSAVNPDLFAMDGIDTYDNYNKIAYNGLELTASWTDHIGKLQYSVGGTLLLPRGKYLRYSEREINAYNKVEGSMLGSYHGYKCLGKFTSEEEIAASPVQSFDSNVQVGDLKYKDMNDDKVIDSNDMTIVGNTNAKCIYSLNLSLKYAGFDLTVVGVGRAGFDTAMTNSYFWNGWGTDNYSVFVRDNIGGAYPRLSYDKLTNNFQKSDFWLRDGSWFKVKNIELGYNFSTRGLKFVNGMRVFLRGTNLLTLTNVEYVDPESTASGVSTDPLFSTFTGGLKFNF